MNKNNWWGLVLNLIINGLPSKQNILTIGAISFIFVLNLIINGLPSKLVIRRLSMVQETVLNLIINGLPSKPPRISFPISFKSI